MINLKDKKILVMGATGGIGRETAILLSKLGAKLVISGRNIDRLDEVFNLLEGTLHRKISFDIKNINEVSTFIKDIVEFDNIKLDKHKLIIEDSPKFQGDERDVMLVSLGVFFAVISDSYVTANIFTFSSYILGHFTGDILELVKVTSNEAIKVIMKLLTILLPRYSVLNYRDFIYNIEVNHLKISIYVIIYILIVTLISSLIFEKRKL